MLQNELTLKTEIYCLSTGTDVSALEDCGTVV